MKPLGFLFMAGGLFTIAVALAYIGEVDPTMALATILYAGLSNILYAFLALAGLLLFFMVGGALANLLRGKK